MYIIIIGCGKVGLSLAEQLSDENHDITLVDSSADKLQNLSDDLDVMKILGNGASISTLQDAGIERADILIAVTGSDELNLLCCLNWRRPRRSHGFFVFPRRSRSIPSRKAGQSF